MDCKDKILELRESTGMNRREFSHFLQISYRTVTEWNSATAMRQSMYSGC